MIGLSQITLFGVLALLLNLTSGKNSCRQCTGVMNYEFNNFISVDDALEFLKTSIGDCTTGQILDLTTAHAGPADCQYRCRPGETGPQCLEPGATIAKCKYWYFNLTVYRYCGNGGSVKLEKGEHCAAGLCAIKESLTLTCTKSVGCVGNCNCAQCGC